MLNRILYAQLKNGLFGGKILVIYGPRQVGKTTLVKKLLEEFEGTSRYFQGDDPGTKNLFQDRTQAELVSLVKNFDLVVLDEAQQIKNIGLILKLIYDAKISTQIIATGSSSFDLANQINEPLTGRKRTFFLYPLSTQELVNTGILALELPDYLDTILRFGLYPGIWSVNQQNKAEDLLELTQNYLFKDIFSFEELRNPELLTNLLKALALQLGQEVSYRELATLLRVDQTTIQRYIRLLEQAFVIFRLNPLSRNLRNEISKSRKIYFYDLGIRNSLLSNFNPLELRSDVGALWENFCIVERMKLNSYTGSLANTYFWRTYSQQEIDYVEEQGGQLQAFEFKWNPNKKVRFPRTFLENYLNSSTQTVHPQNFWQFTLSQSNFDEQLV